MQKQFQLMNEQATKRLAEQLALVVGKQAVIYLYGELGAGETSLVRYFIKGLGYSGLVKSPTYTLVEPYKLGEVNLYHYDLYRLNNSEELEFIGLRDYLDTIALHFIEWPERGREYLPLPDLSCTITMGKDSSRTLTLVATTKLGITILKKIDET